MPKKGENIYKRKDGRWEGRYIKGYVRYINGQKITKTVTPVLGEKAAHNGNVVYSLDFQVTPHQLRHTYIRLVIYVWRSLCEVTWKPRLYTTLPL